MRVFPFHFHSFIDRLNLPSILVLNGCGISRAGDEAEISAFCAHVVELDLSNNKLQDWHEVGSQIQPWQTPVGSGWQ